MNVSPVCYQDQAIWVPAPEVAATKAGAQLCVQVPSREITSHLEQARKRGRKRCLRASLVFREDHKQALGA